MSDRIRYALGQSAHGAFIAALSNRGLVAFDFVAGADNAAGGLLARFPDATIEEDVEGLATTLATLSRAVESTTTCLSLDEGPNSAPTLGLVALINRLVRKDGSLVSGRACAASVRAAASRHVLPRIPDVVTAHHHPSQ
jgi:hypothetical protein